MDLDEVKRQQEETNTQVEANNKLWEETVIAAATGKGEGKGFQGSGYMCGEHGRSMRDCPTTQSYKRGKDQGKGGKGNKGDKGEHGEGKGYQGTGGSCGIVGHSQYNSPLTYK